MNRLIYTIFALIVSVAVMAAEPFTLVIDAGHGGHDPGAIGAFSKEKDINLRVALAFGRMVEENCPGVKVIYTRKTDVFIELNERANIANRNKANLFISVHTNALPKGHVATGFETYTLGMARADENLEVAKRENAVITYEKNYQQKYEGFNPNSAESYIMFEFMQDKNMAQSVELAKEIQTYACRMAGRNDKGVHQAGFLVLRKTSMPSCLIELGFISTPSEEEYLNSSTGVDALAKGIFEAFSIYRNKHDKNVVGPYKTASSSENIPTIVPRRNTNTAAETERPARNTSADTPQNKPSEQNIAAANDAQNKPADTGRNRNERVKKTLASMYADKPGLYFRLQLFVSKRMLRPGAQQFKDVDEVDYYQEDDLFKYVKGESADYNEIKTLKGKLAEKFPESFIIAIKNGVKVQLSEAIKEYNDNKTKR